jgi:hypothetical protein
MAERDMGQDMLKGAYREAQDSAFRITPPAPVVKSNRPDGDGPKPPR